MDFNTFRRESKTSFTPDTMNYTVNYTDRNGTSHVGPKYKAYFESGIRVFTNESILLKIRDPCRTLNLLAEGVDQASPLTTHGKRDAGKTFGAMT